MLRMTYPGFIFRTLSQEGHDPARMLEGTGLTGADFYDPDLVTELPPLHRFILNAIEETGEPHLGIRLAKRFEASFIGLPAYAAMNAATFQDALAVLSRFFFLAFPVIEFTFPDHQASVRFREFSIRLRPRLPLGDISYFASSSAVVACEGLFRSILRIPKAVHRAELGIRRPLEWQRIEGQVGFPISFEAQDIRLFLAEELLAQPLPGADPLNHQRLLALCEYVAENARVEDTPVGKVDSFLQEGQNLSLPVSKVAAALGYSERSLRRHLEQSGTTFRQLTNEIRERRARGMLASTSVPIQTIAHDLGFDSPSNFSRSFKRWTGVSPTVFRMAQSDPEIPGQK